MVKEVEFTEKVPISHHLIEIKDRTIQVALVVAFFFGVSFYFIEIFLLWLEDPLPKQFADLTFITPTEPFFKLYIFYVLSDYNKLRNHERNLQSKGHNTMNK